MRVFITGGTGLVGSHAAEHFRDAGAEVVCLQRPSSDTGFLRSIGCRIVTGDVRDDPERTAEAMAGCDRLVHSAALVYSEGPWPRIRAVNVEGTAKVLRSAARAGIRRAVHVSSVAVYGDAPGPLDESAPTDLPLRPTDLYARSKREAEGEAFAVAREGQIELCVLRLSAVYGERDRIFAPALASFLRWPVTPLLGPGANRMPVVYGGNAAVGIAVALELPEAAGEIFNLGADHPVTQREMLSGLARGMDESVRFVSLPAGLVRWGARMGDSLGFHPPGARDLSLSRVAELALTDNPFRTERARRVLGWRPPVHPDEALRRTGGWLRGREEGSESSGKRSGEGR